MKCHNAARYDGRSCFLIYLAHGMPRKAQMQCCLHKHRAAQERMRRAAIRLIIVLYKQPSYAPKKGGY